MDLVVFRAGGQEFALPAREVQEVALRPATVQIGPMPPWIEGFFSVDGRTVALLRLDRLLHLSEDADDLYSHVVLLQDHPMALGVARVVEVATVPANALKPLPPGHAFNRAVAALVERKTGPVALLSGKRLLMEEEQERLNRFAGLAEERLRDG